MPNAPEQEAQARELIVQSLMEWLEATSLAVFIHQNPWAFTTVQVIHVAAISLVVATIAMVDVRLLGFASTKRPFVELARGILPYTWAAFIVAVAAGSLLFISRATEYYVNPVFLIKMFLIVVAGINMLVFELITVRGVEEWNLKPIPPRAARLAGGISLACWMLVVVFGRWTDFVITPQ